MKVEKILNKVPIFKDLVLDTILFESNYPVLFTCKNGNEEYLFSCCLINAKIVKWIGTKTSFETLIQLHQNKITIREAFLNDEMITVEYDGQNVQYRKIDKTQVPSELLPTAGEYMDAEEDEYAEEIELFETRSRSTEFKINLQNNNFYTFTYSGKDILLSDDFFNIDVSLEDERIIGLQEIINCNVAYA